VCPGNMCEVCEEGYRFVLAHMECMKVDPESEQERLEAKKREQLMERE